MSLKKTTPNKIGMILLDKPSGISSQQGVYRVRKALGFSKAGHTGTLDPLATGVLPIALGPATKWIPYLKENQKTYRVVSRLGVSTDTYDADGKIVCERSPDALHVKDLDRALQTFQGDLSQRPPLYSAVKIKGKALYRYAREGQTVEIPTRQVQIHSLEILNWESPHCEIRIKCSRGTYVRSLIHDWGETLGCGAHVTELRREATGPFSLDQALSLKQIEGQADLVLSRLITREQCLKHLPSWPLKHKDEALRVVSGGALPEPLMRGELSGGIGDLLMLTHQERGLAILRHDGLNWRYDRVFSENSLEG